MSRLFDVERIQRLVSTNYLGHAESAFGTDGVEGIKALMNSVKLIFQHCPPEALVGTLTVIFGLNISPQQPTISQFGKPTRLDDFSSAGRYLARCQAAHAVVEMTSDGALHLLDLMVDLDLKSVASGALIYRFEKKTERFLAKNFEDYVPTVSPMLLSNFAVPTLSGLEEALDHYREIALECKCRILKEVWVNGVDGPRLVLVNKPESIFRDSLCQMLEVALREATVKPEQNTDESKPVDIRVSWFGVSATALIEVKWLGKSIAQPRQQSATPTYTQYSMSRAQSGAGQLADYLDREVRHSSATIPRGYLVVFDARRRGTEGPDNYLSEEDAMAFAAEPLQFDPDHSATRDDFAEPVRLFLNPRKSHFLHA
jgi:hypothetical protein